MYQHRCVGSCYHWQILLKKERFALWWDYQRTTESINFTPLRYCWGWSLGNRRWKCHPTLKNGQPGSFCLETWKCDSIFEKLKLAWNLYKTTNEPQAPCYWKQQGHEISASYPGKKAMSGPDSCLLICLELAWNCITFGRDFGRFGSLVDKFQESSHNNLWFHWVAIIQRYQPPFLKSLMFWNFNPKALSAFCCSPAMIIRFGMWLKWMSGFVRWEN